MAKKKSYRVLYAVNVTDKSGADVYLTRANEGQVADLLAPKRIAELVAGGVLAEDVTEEPEKK